MILKLVPATFDVPQRLEHPLFVARKLGARDVYLDYIAVMSSIDLIRRTRGGKWPTPDLNIEEDLIDLAWHQREFEQRTSFAFTVMNPTETECLGCFYLFSAGYRGKVPEGADVDVSFWVTQRAYDQGLYPELYQSLKGWLAEKWPFKQPFWSNRDLPA
jgi:hypothetical protein